MYFLRHFVMTTIVVFIISLTAHSVNCNGEQGPKTDKEENTAAIGEEGPKTNKEENTETIVNCNDSLTNIGFTGKLQHDKNHKLNFQLYAGLYVPTYERFLTTINVEENAADTDSKITSFIDFFCEDIDKVKHTREECRAALKNYEMNGKIYKDYNKMKELGDNFMYSEYGYPYTHTLRFIRIMLDKKREDVNKGNNNETHAEQDAKKEDVNKGNNNETHVVLEKLKIIDFFCDEKVEYHAKADEGEFPDVIEIEVKKAAVGEKAKTV